eukprot:TRINITY_DN3217_c0_g1_i3.p1 TRINITY_DN3217_c0_g1~~TRINITY_DN3217_c0_g1_i3.p1  ORF type:complete len:374 (+),score=67.54 TRINITY_DN3217_c0_g1_i3:429-1550(+)
MNAASQMVAAALQYYCQPGVRFVVAMRRLHNASIVVQRAFRHHRSRVGVQKAGVLRWWRRRLEEHRLTLESNFDSRMRQIRAGHQPTERRRYVARSTEASAAVLARRLTLMDLDPEVQWAVVDSSRALAVRAFYRTRRRDRDLRRAALWRKHQHVPGLPGASGAILSPLTPTKSKTIGVKFGVQYCSFEALMHAYRNKTAVPEVVPPVLPSPLSPSKSQARLIAGRDREPHAVRSNLRKAPSGKLAAESTFQHVSKLMPLQPHEHGCGGSRAALNAVWYQHKPAQRQARPPPQRWRHSDVGPAGWAAAEDKEPTDAAGFPLPPPPPLRRPPSKLRPIPTVSPPRWAAAGDLAREMLTPLPKRRLPALRAAAPH